MKKLLLIPIVALAMACGDPSRSNAQREAAAEEEMDAASGEEISPQLELDSTESRFQVDSTSADEIGKESAPDNE